MNWFTRLFKRNYDPFLENTFSFNYSHEPITSQTALQVPPYVSAVNLLSSSLSKLGRHVYKDGERVENHPLEKLLDNPNPFIDGYTFFNQAEMQRLNEGNAYIHIARNLEGSPKALMLIDPANVTHKIENNQFYYEVRQVESVHRINPEDMIHVKAPFTDTDAFKGIGYYSVLKEQLGLWLSAQKHQSRYFALGSDPTSLLTTDEKLSPEKREQVRKAWEKLNGNENRHRVAVLDAGFKFNKVGNNFSDLEMNDMFNELSLQIASTFNLSPYLLGREGSKNTYSNVESQNMQFLQHSLMPSIETWEHQLSKLDRNYDVRFNYESLLRADSKSRAERLTQLVNANIITANEAREYEGLKAL